MFNSKAQALSDFVDDILQGETAIIELIVQAFACISGERTGWNEREKFTELLGGRAAITQLAVARKTDDLLDMLLANLFLRRLPQFGQGHRQVAYYAFASVVSSQQRRKPAYNFTSRWPSSPGGGLQNRRGWCEYVHWQNRIMSRASIIWLARASMLSAPDSPCDSTLTAPASLGTDGA